MAGEGIFVQDYKKLTPSFLPPKLDHSAQMLTGQYVQTKELKRESRTKVTLIKSYGETYDTLAVVIWSMSIISWLIIHIMARY